MWFISDIHPVHSCASAWWLHMLLCEYLSQWLISDCWFLWAVTRAMWKSFSSSFSDSADQFCFWWVFCDRLVWTSDLLKLLKAQRTYIIKMKFVFCKFFSFVINHIQSSPEGKKTFWLNISLMNTKFYCLLFRNLQFQLPATFFLCSI